MYLALKVAPPIPLQAYRKTKATGPALYLKVIFPSPQGEKVPDRADEGTSPLTLLRQIYTQINDQNIIELTIFR